MARRIIVCGGRDYDDWPRVQEVLCGRLHVDDVVVTGGARGADRLADRYAWQHGMAHENYFADWDTHGKRAGPIRNQQMLDTGVDLVIAFPGGRGTDDMIGRAMKAGVEVIVVQPSGA